MSMMRSTRWIAGSVLMLSLAVAPAAAQRRPPMMEGGAGGQRREQLEERIRARFAQMIKERLGLDDSTAQALNRTVESFQHDRGQLARDQAALRKRLQAFAIEGGGSDQEAQHLLDQMRQLRNREDRLFDSEQDSLSKVLSPSQLLRFDVMREELVQRIQQIRMRGMMGRGRGMGRGGGPGGPGGGGPGGPGGFDAPPGGGGPGLPGGVPFGTP